MARRLTSNFVGALVLSPSCVLAHVPIAHPASSFTLKSLLHPSFACPMPPRRKKKPRTSCISPSLEKLLGQLREWCDDDSVDTLKTAQEAATAVSSAIQQHGVSYEESLNGWWKWHLRSIEADHQTTLKETLYRDVVQHAAAAPRDELQLAKLLPPVEHSTTLPHLDLVKALKQLQPKANMKRSQTEAHRLAKILSPFLEHDNAGQSSFDFRWYKEDTGELCIEDVDSLQKLFFRLWRCAELKTRAVTLSLRVIQNSRLDEVCQALDEHYEMTTTICPVSQWCFGPPTQLAKVASDATEAVRLNRLPHRDDQRYYLIIGTPGALTKSHWDRGVQSVLYHTVAGTNHAVAVPRRVALMLQAVDDASSDFSWSHELECESLRGTATQAGTFAAGETMLIMPGGGHAVLTGDEGKVVLAGEWHLRTDI